MDAKARRTTDSKSDKDMTTTTKPPLTEFQKTIVWAIERMPNRMANTWEIAWNGFPERWRKKSAHGGLIAQIHRACLGMGDIVGRLDPKQEHEAATYYCKQR